MNKLIILGLFTLIGISAVSGCRKKEDTIALITVRNASNELVVGAQVVLFGQSTTSQPASVALYDTTVTDDSGVATFNFNEVYQLGQAGVAVLDIDVVKDGQTGQGIIKIEQEQTSEETVFVQ